MHCKFFTILNFNALKFHIQLMFHKIVKTITVSKRRTFSKQYLKQQTESALDLKMTMTAKVKSLNLTKIAIILDIS